jgi:hypothetical protein
MQYVYRYNLKEDKSAEFRQWLLGRAGREILTEGWSYLGTWFTVLGFGRWDCESRWEVDGYGSLGKQFINEDAEKVFAEWLDFIDGGEAFLMKSAEDVQIRGQ